MSGIAGVVGTLGSDGSHYRNWVEAMLTQLRHRGPDSFVVRAWDHVCFGHVRLSIEGFSEMDDQPLCYSDGNYWIVLDGGIHNGVEVRAELKGLGYDCQTSSDAVVVLAAYHRWGPDCLSHFNGTWALAIYDRRERACFVARDRFGVKPLYYAHHKSALLLASEMKALLAAGVPAEPDLETIRWYLRDAGCDRGDLTPFKAIRQLPAGHYMVIRNGEQAMHRWWDTLAHRVDVPRKFSDRTETFRELLEDAVRIRLRSDAKIAVTLSGGLDSSTVYALSRVLQRRNQAVAPKDGRAKDVPVFSVSYPGQAIDESAYVDHCVSVYDEQAHYVHPAPTDFARLLPEIIWHQESFAWNASVLAYHIMYRQIAEAGIRVILEGHGSDEMLAGYPYLVRSALRSFVARGDWRGAWQAAKCLSDTLNPAVEEQRTPAWQIIGKQLPILGKAVSLWQMGVKRFGAPRSARAVPDRMIRSKYLSPELLTAPQAAFHVPGEQELDPLRSDLYDAFHRRILPNALRVFDRATMASSIACRMPFLDHRVVQYVFSLPISDIVAGGETKHILREAMRDIVPAPVVNRKAKLGFAVPLKAWFDDPVVHNHLAEIIHDPAFAEHGLVNGAAFAADFDRCVKEGFSWTDTVRVWEMVNLSLWWQIFVRDRIQVGPDDSRCG